MQQHNENVRVRFAPSPTGHLHIGGLRAAFFNWLFAQHYKGTYLLRIEDTDSERSKQEYTDSIIASFVWVNLLPQEPIVIQSSRADVHRSLVANLIKNGKAYRCFCKSDAHLQRYKIRTGQDGFFVPYDGYCRDLLLPHSSVDSYVVRFKVPHDQADISFNDLIRGVITFTKDQIDDFIIARSDASPVYNFVVVVDDAWMKITHVIRGEEHISNTPKQLLLYQALGYNVPYFAHLPLILGASGEPLSKRDGATSVLEYRANGYLPEALLNYLVRLGWSHGDQEIFSLNELITTFSLEHISKKGAIFDMVKLDWLNNHYIREKDAAYLLDALENGVMPSIKTLLTTWSIDTIYRVITLYKDRVKTLKELGCELIMLHDGPQKNAPQDMQTINADAQEYSTYLYEILASLEEFSVDLIKNALGELGKRLGIKTMMLAQPLRTALIGKNSGPNVYELASVVGKSETLHRLQVLLSSTRAQ